MRIQGRDQHILFLPSPTFELLLPRERIAHLTVVLMIDEMNAVIVLGEAAELRAGTVLPDSHPQFARDADVKGRARIVADDVDPVVVVGSAQWGERARLEICRRSFSPFYSALVQKTRREILRLRSG